MSSSKLQEIDHVRSLRSISCELKQCIEARTSSVIVTVLKLGGALLPARHERVSGHSKISEPVLDLLAAK